MLRKTIRRIKRRYRYLPIYLRYRVRHNFSPDQRQALRALAADVESFDTGRLFAVGNEGLIFEGSYKPSPDTPHLLKVAINAGQFFKPFKKACDVLQKADLPFICKIPEYAVWAKDADYWRQVQERVPGMMLSQYLQIRRERRAAVCSPLLLCIDLLEQTNALSELRIIAPNEDAENVMITPAGGVVRIDLTPYQLVQKGKLPLFHFRRLFKLVLYVLADHENHWRSEIRKGEICVDSDAFDALFHGLRSSAIFGYDDPRKNRHKNDHLVDPSECFTHCDQALETLHALREALEMTLH